MPAASAAFTAAARSAASFSAALLAAARSAAALSAASRSRCAAASRSRCAAAAFAAAASSAARLSASARALASAWSRFCLAISSIFSARFFAAASSRAFLRAMISAAFVETFGPLSVSRRSTLSSMEPMPPPRSPPEASVCPSARSEVALASTKVISSRRLPFILRGGGGGARASPARERVGERWTVSAVPRRSREPLGTARDGEKSRVLRVLDVNGTLTFDRNGNALGSGGTYSALRSLHRRNDSLFPGDGAHEGGRECQRAVSARREAGAPCGLRWRKNTSLQKNFRWRRPNVRENARCGVRACEPVEAVVALELAVHLVYVLPGGAFRRGHAPSIESAQLPIPERRDAGSGQRSRRNAGEKSPKASDLTGKQSET